VSLTDPFKVLGLSRDTATQSDVKSAYARLLKVTRPEDDRAAFMELREAFEQARRTVPVQLPIAEAPAKTSVETETGSQLIKPVRRIEWYYDDALNWNFDTSPKGKLSESVIRWMVACGPDAATRVPAFAEACIALDKHDADAFLDQITEFIFAATDPEERRHTKPVWEPIEGARPAWLSDDLIRALANGIGLLQVRPMNAYTARSFNTVQALFASVLDRNAAAAPVDVLEKFQHEQNEANKDDHGS
jgi:hypothetical protein